MSDITQMPKLLHGEEREVFGDQAYWNEVRRQTTLAAGIRYRINRRSSRRPLSKYQRFINRRRSAARARVEHVFHVVKRLWGFSKVRYRGLAKKHRTAVHHFRPGEFVPVAAATAANVVEVSVVIAMSARNGEKCSPNALFR